MEFLVQLEHFIAVADERTFTRAASGSFARSRRLAKASRSLKRSGCDPVRTGQRRRCADGGGKAAGDDAHRILKLRDEAARSIAQLQNLETY